MMAERQRRRRRRRSNAGRETLAGSARVFAAEALLLPTGLVTAGVLTRWLGTGGYGVLTLAGTFTMGVEWIIVSLFGRATIRVVRDTPDWKPLAGRVLRISLALGLSAMCLIWLLAPTIARLLNAPEIVAPLRLFAIDIPIFTYAWTHNGVLTGLGKFNQRARVVAARWTSRMILIVALVLLGFSITGAILGQIGSSFVMLLFATRYDRPTLRTGGVSVRPFVRYAIPIFGATLLRRAYSQIDLFALKALGGSIASAGLYGAAQVLSFVPGAVAASFSPLLLSTLTGLVRDGDLDHAKDMARDAQRLIVLLLPFVVLAAASSREIAIAVFGADFAASGPVLAWLIFGGLALIFVAVSSTILLAAGRPMWQLWATVPILPLALVGHWFAIPRHGAIGAAIVTTAATFLGAALMAGAVYRCWQILPRAMSIARSVAVAAAAWLVATAWPTPGFLVFAKLAALSIGIVALYVVLREFDRRELELAWSIVPKPKRS